MRFAYSRTFRDLEALVYGQMTLGRNLKILEVGAFTRIVSVALANLGHEVTASDIPFCFGR
jgi:2-polyprenyl-3-methyl-5-hydroxy-6-metoxy-1,4-benzoquinol methylase